MRLFLILAFLLVTPVQAASLLEGTLQWFDENHHRALETLRSGSDAERALIINSIGLVISRADGALMYEIEPYFQEVVMARPALFLEWFENHPQEFAMLLRVSEESYFLAESDAEAVELDARRLRMIESRSAASRAGGRSGSRDRLKPQPAQVGFAAKRDIAKP